jgi:sugar transferase EpsL
VYTRIKRALDIVGAVALLLLTAPLMGLVAAAVRLTMGRPALFRPRRPGLNEVSFTCLKFRTMADARDARGLPLPDSKRLTRLGVFLRRTSLDELPQLWNILVGDLSFIGPRPLLESYLPYYSDTERRRHSVRPGLTGWAQIHGRNCLGFDERLAMDVWYVDNASVWLDGWILLATVWVTITGKGAAADHELLPLHIERASERSADCDWTEAPSAANYGSERQLGAGYD